MKKKIPIGSMAHSKAMQSGEATQPTKKGGHEIRLRNVSTALMQKAEKCQSALRKKTITDTVETLFTRYFEDQESIRQLQKRNSDLHTAIQKYYSKEDSSRYVIDQFIKTASTLSMQAKHFENTGKKLVKQFGNKKGGKR